MGGNGAQGVSDGVKVGHVDGPDQAFILGKTLVSHNLLQRTIARRIATVGVGLNQKVTGLVRCAGAAAIGVTRVGVALSCCGAAVIVGG